MIDKDDKLLSEAFDDVGQIDEGMFDRLRGKSAGNTAYKAAGGKTGLSGLAQKAKHGAIRGMGGTINRKEQQVIDKATGASNAANVTEVVAQHVLRIQADLNKMNIDLSMIEDDQLRKAVQGIMEFETAKNTAPIE